MSYTREEAMVRMIQNNDEFVHPELFNDGKGDTYYYDKQKCLHNAFRFGNRNAYNEHADMDFTDGYELYTPPKKKVKMWKWAAMFSDGVIDDSAYASTKEEAVRISRDNNGEYDYPFITSIIQRLDYTEIEVEK